MKTKKHIAENGYFSVEASLIMPIVLYSIIFLIYIGFFQYNRCLFEQDSYRMLIRGEQVRQQDNETVCNEMRKQDTHWYYDKYMLSSFDEKTIEVSYNQICIAQHMSMKVPFGMLQKWTKDGAWTKEVNVKGSRVRPVETIRNCRKVEELADKMQ